MIKNKLLTAVSLFIVAASFGLCGCQSTKATGKQPNIIVLLADDLRADAMSYSGNQIVKTPNLDQLAEKGCFFNEAYVTTSICAVSRASIFTGQYARRHGIHGFARSLSEEQMASSYPVRLRDNGYVTGFIGKYGVGSNMPVDKFDYWKGFGGQGIYQAKDKNGEDIHLTRLMTQQMEEFINEYGSGDQPFCLSVSFKAPHVQEDHNPATLLFPYDDAFEEYYADTPVSHPETGGDEYYYKFPEAFRVNEGYENEARVRWKERFSTDEKYQESVKGYYRLVNGIDRAVGDLFKTLEEKNLAENTIIIFLSDNGFYLGEHGLAGKWYGHEESIRIPMMIFDPRSKGSEKSSEIALNIDVAPTILDYAGIDIPVLMQGKSLRPLISGENVDWREEFLYEHLLYLKNTGGWYVYIPQTEGVVTDDYKYMRYFYHNDPHNPMYEELYNTKEDPKEKKNLIKSEPDKVKELKSRLEELIEKSK